MLSLSGGCKSVIRTHVCLDSVLDLAGLSPRTVPTGTADPQASLTRLSQAPMLRALRWGRRALLRRLFQGGTLSCGRRTYSFLEVQEMRKRLAIVSVLVLSIFGVVAASASACEFHPCANRGTGIHPVGLTCTFFA